MNAVMQTELVQNHPDFAAVSNYEEVDSLANNFFAMTDHQLSYLTGPQCNNNSCVFDTAFMFSLQMYRHATHSWRDDLSSSEITNYTLIFYHQH